LSEASLSTSLAGGNETPAGQRHSGAGMEQMRPVPSPDNVSAGYWRAAAARQLAIQRCAGCGHWNHPPVMRCPVCHSLDLQFEAVSGRGTVYQYVIVHQTKLAGFEDQVPYAAAVVELDEQPDLVVVTNIVGPSALQAQIGQRVHVDFEPTTGGFVLPQFRHEGHTDEGTQ
jgi:uncharacterized OB-fold protein